MPNGFSLSRAPAIDSPGSFDTMRITKTFQTGHIVFPVGNCAYEVARIDYTKLGGADDIGRSYRCIYDVGLLPGEVSKRNIRRV